MSNLKEYTLNFHSIYNDSQTFHFDKKFSLDESKLIQLLTLIKASGKKVNLSFDDGHLSDGVLVLPILKEMKMSATFFVLASSIKTDKQKYEQTKLLHNSGFRIGSHGYKHCDLTKLTNKELEFEILKSKQIIEECVNSPIVDFALPLGRYNRKVLTKLKFAGYEHVYTTDSYPSDQRNFLIHRYNLKNKVNLIFLTDSMFKEKILQKTFFLSKIFIKNYLQKIIS